MDKISTFTIGPLIPSDKTEYDKVDGVVYDTLSGVAFKLNVNV